LRVPRQKYKTLVEEAAACNFNMLRVWGGGLYEPDCFYDYCSEHGILIMQDFMYACAFYPDNLPWFMHEAALEAEYQTKRLGAQACLALWTGNNEVHESFTDWFPGETAPQHLSGAKIFNYLLPDIVRKNTPMVPYMPSSPFYGNRANDLFSGDSHVWSWMRPPQETGFAFTYELEAFDRLAAKVRFSSEYGFYGALKPSSVTKFFDGEEIQYENEIWRHHGEHEGKKRLIREAINRHLTDAADLDKDAYLLYCGIMQGILYEEMTTALRSQGHCSGQLIWMYNDCWPETGWTVIDSYTTRKNSFYFLKRAFALKKLIIRVKEGALRISCVNDSPEILSVDLVYGYMDFAGHVTETRVHFLQLPAFSREDFTAQRGAEDLTKGFYFVKEVSGCGFDPAISLRGYYRAVVFPKAEIRVAREEKWQGGTKLVVVSDQFVPVAHVRTPDDTTRLSDNYFFLLPKEEKEIWMESQDTVSIEPVLFKPAQEG
jgi:beta-mannosidase